MCLRRKYGGFKQELTGAMPQLRHKRVLMQVL
jgi:hypothetical protein